MTVIENIAKLMAEIGDLQAKREGVMEDFAAGMPQRDAQERVEEIEDELRDKQRELADLLED